MTEAFFAVAQAAQRQADGLGLVEEFLGQVAGGEIPEVLAVFKHIGQGEQGGLGAAILAQREGGDTADVGHGAVAQQVVQDLVFRAQHAAGLNVDQHGAAGELFHLVLESLGHFTNDGAFHGVDFRVGQGDGVRHRSGAADEQGKGQEQTDQFLHKFFPPEFFTAGPFFWILSQFGQKVYKKFKKPPIAAGTQRPTGFLRAGRNLCPDHCVNRPIVVYCLKTQRRRRDGKPSVDCRSGPAG